MPQHEESHLTAEPAEIYERYSVRYLLGPWASLLVGTAAIRAGEHVLDVACGTGAVARLAAERVGAAGQVTGLDLSAGMLAVARSLPPPAGPAITWVEGNAVAMNFADKIFDVVLCQQGLQFFSDKLAALREMRRVLTPGGRLILSVWKSKGIYNTAVGNALERYAGAEVAALFCASRDVPNAEELRRLILDAGFRCVNVRPAAMTMRLPSVAEFTLCHLASTPVASAVAALDEKGREALRKDIARQLQPYVEGEGVAFPEETNIATAHT